LADTSLVKTTHYHQTAGKMKKIPWRSSEAKKYRVFIRHSQTTSKIEKIQPKAIIS